MKQTWIIGALAILAANAATMAAVAAPTPITIGQQPDGSFLVPTNQTLTPAGKIQRIEKARPKDLAVSPDGKVVAIVGQNKVSLYNTAGDAITTLTAPSGPMGIAWSPDSQSLFVAGYGGSVTPIVCQQGVWKATHALPIVSPAETSDRKQKKLPTGDQPAGIVVSPDGTRLYVAMNMWNAIKVLGLPAGDTIATIPVGVCPYSIVLSPDGKTLFVANRGGRAALPGEVTEPSAATDVRVNATTDASLSGSLSFVDTSTFKTTQIDAGRQPSALCVSSDGKALFVANSDDDTVSIVETQTKRIKQTFAVGPFADPGFGQMPSGLALSEDGATLYVTCGGGNSVAVVALPHPHILGYIPTGWYPIAVAERSGTLFVASSKGIGPRIPDKDGNFGVHNSIGIVQFIKIDPNALAGFTDQVKANNHWGAYELKARRHIAAVPVPERVGEPSVFKHVIYIIKENHTYDLTLGDVPEGNGDKALCLFGEDITPNHHALARQFVLLDNTFTSGTCSADGHQWCDSAVANDYMERAYGAYKRSYPFDGGDPLAYAPTGFIWNAALKAGKTVRVYGEFVNHPKVVDKVTGATPTWAQVWQDYKTNTGKYSITAETDNLALRPILHPNYIGFPLTVSDQWRADVFIEDLARFETTGKMPSLCLLELPNDHTGGTSPVYPTPQAFVADNDLALGRIVEAVGKSKFWKDTLILVIEDDSQFGIDHVDGHRTTAFCVSPYSRRGVVVSVPYNHTSLVRTIGLVLGIPAMNRFDRTATPMAACFTSTPDFHPYTHIENRIPLDEMNPKTASLHGAALDLALASLRQNWSAPDKANAAVVARSVWYAQRPNQAFPVRYFHPNKDQD